jgi:glycosyltransferase involved in cell wall biosynthesis
MRKSARPDIAVFYLARLAEGFEAFERFVASYQTYPAGIDHDLVLIAKGFDANGSHDLKRLQSIFRGVPHRIVTVADEIGYDIHAYKTAAAQIEWDCACFINTFTELQSDNWLRKLYDNLSDSDVGIVGATGSYESLYNSMKALNKASWSCTQHVRFDAKLAASFEWYLRMTVGRWLRPLRTWRRLTRPMTDTLRRRVSWRDLSGSYEHVWTNFTNSNGPLAVFANFPRFPNPHIRSNVFMLRRDLFNAVPLPGDSKIGCCEFESGRDGLSRAALSRGLKLLVVGADGRGYDLDEWPLSDTFRLGRQNNLLAHDNQTRAYTDMSKAEKLSHRIMTWSGYQAGIPAELIGVGFPAIRRVSDVARDCVTPDGTKAPLISVVIPTRGRLDLVLEAVKTVVAQSYANWELIVFDNGSQEPLQDRLAELKDLRIRYARSEVFLPVTDSWNNAIDFARGDYVMLMGDDDGLAPHFFERIAGITRRFSEPELIVSNLIQFLHAGVLGESILRHLPMGFFFKDRDFPFVLDPADAARAVEGSLAFKRNFYFNMQAFTMSRTLLDRIRGGGQVFRSPFPDYYLANVAIALSKKTVVEPRPLAIQGVSKGSFGWNLFSNTLAEGFKTLNTNLAEDACYRRIADQLLPGSLYHTNVILTMQYVHERLETAAPNFERYRKVQILEHITRTNLGWWLSPEGGALWRMLTARERAWALAVHMLRKVGHVLKWPFRILFNRIARSCSPYDFSHTQAVIDRGSYSKTSEVFDRICRTENPVQ